MVGYITIKIPKLKDLVHINPIIKEESLRFFRFMYWHKKAILLSGTFIVGLVYWERI